MLAIQGKKGPKLLLTDLDHLIDYSAHQFSTKTDSF